MTNHFKLVVPTLQVSKSGVGALGKLWNDAREKGFDRNYVFDFSITKFVCSGTVAFIGGLAALIRSNGGQVSIDVANCNQGVYANLRQNGLLVALGVDQQPITRKAIPWHQFSAHDEDIVIRYLKEDWLGRSALNLSTRVADAIAGETWEIFDNAFEHSRSAVGVSVCGQHFSAKKMSVLSIVDFGCGIPENVRRVEQGLSDRECLIWAFKVGNSSSPDHLEGKVSRGLGLDLLYQFVQLTSGSLEIFSCGAHARILPGKGLSVGTASGFNGTLVSIGINCDDSRLLCFADELESDVLRDIF